MFAKVSIFVIGIFLIGIILFSGCVAPESDNLGTTKSALTNSGDPKAPNNGGPSEVDNVIPINNPPSGEDTEKQPTDSTLDYSNATPQQLLDALGLAQLLGLPTDEIDAATKAKIKQWAEGIINDPNSTNSMLVNALQLLQSIGLMPNLDKVVLDIIKNRLTEEINDQYTCKNRLKEIVILCDQLGFDDLKKLAEQKQSGAGNQCSRIKYEYLTEAKDTYYFTKIDIVGGTLKRYSVLGQTLGTRSYYFEDGKFIWNYKMVVDNGCVIINKEGSGTVSMESENQSLMGFDENNHYGGAAFISAELKVTKSVSPTRVEYCDEVPDNKLGTSKEYENLQIHFEGYAKMDRAVGQKSQSWKPPEDQESGYEYTCWDLSIGE